MQVMVLGLRGFPGVQGGVETHAEQLYPRLAQLGCDVDVVVRSRYMPEDVSSRWRGVRFRRLWSPGPRLKGLETFLHTFLGTLYAGVKRPDLLHIHAIGPAIMAPLGRLLGLKVVVTHHGPDYDREKWGAFARRVLRVGERLGMQFAHRSIVISNTTREIVRTKYHRDSVFIPNGVQVGLLVDSGLTLQSFGLDAHRYVLMVSRMVPEKRHLDLIRAFERAGLDGWKLVLVGGLEPDDEYSRAVVTLGQATPHVVLTGFQTGTALQELYSRAGIFVLPSSHEGLPIVLLEALSYGLPVLASAIPANLEVGLPGEHYFPLGSVEALSEKLGHMAGAGFDERRRSYLREWVNQRYDWQRIARETFDVYETVVREDGKLHVCNS